MNVIDSSAWLSYFSGDKNAGKFSRAIENINRLIVPSITITEVFKSVYRQRGEEPALRVIAHIQEGQVVPLDAELALDAASYGLAHKLPLADSIIYATAQKFKATIWTQDGDFEGLSRVKFFPKSKA